MQCHRRTPCLVTLLLILLTTSPAWAARQRTPPRPKPVEGANNDVDVPYLGGERPGKLNVHWPAGGVAGRRFSCIVLVHGGGYGAGDKDDGQFPHNLITRLVNHGFVVANINYLLAFN